jgi:hypothetical protein
MWFKKPQPMPDGLGFDGAMAFYRDALERQCGFVRTMWQWYLLPFAPSMLFIMLGGAMDAAEHGRPLWPAAAMGMIVAIIGVAIHLVSRNAARKLCVRIDSLHSAQER